MSRLKTLARNCGYVAVGAVAGAAVTSKTVMLGLLCICAGAYLAQKEPNQPTNGEHQCTPSRKNPP